MKKTAFAVWGHSGQGKSDTVKKITELLIQNYPNAPKEFAILDFKYDIRVVITIGKIKIGIESMGDPNSRLFESLETFVKVKCDIIICATRTSGATVDAVNELYNKEKYDIVWVTNYRSNEKDTNVLNEMSANHLYELIHQNIKGVI